MYAQKVYAVTRMQPITEVDKKVTKGFSPVEKMLSFRKKYILIDSLELYLYMNYITYMQQTYNW